MQLENFLTTIHFQGNLDKFKDISLKKVNVNTKKNIINIYLILKEMLPLEEYKNLEEQASLFFNSKVYINIENLGDKSLYLEDYFNYFLPITLKYFNERLKINGSNNK